MFLRSFYQQRFARAFPLQHAACFHSAVEFGPPFRVSCHACLPPRSWMTRLVTVAISTSASGIRSQNRVPSVVAGASHSPAGRSASRLATTSLTTLPRWRQFSTGLSALSQVAEAISLETRPGFADAQLDESRHAAEKLFMCHPIGQIDDMPMDPELDEDVPAAAEELQEALSRPPPVNSSYLPLPWKGRLGYACLNTYLRYSNPPVFCSRTCRISSILENRHPLLDPSQPPHPTKNRPDRTKAPDVARGQAYVESLGLANARDLVKLLRWNERYGIKFMRLSSEMFPFASHKEYGYKLAPFASEVLADAGRVIAELGHRVSVHPGQFTQLGSPRVEVVESSYRDLEYHSEMLQLLRLPPQQDRDAAMILHMGGVFGDKQATLDRFRENYQKLSPDIKNRLVLENDDVSWSVHDLLPICEELNIPLVLDFHHHNIIFDSTQMREGTLDIMNLFDRIKATWTRKNITQKMHYSEPVSSAITNSQRRKHSDRVVTLPPCDPTMDLMIEAKDKEQAVFQLIRVFKLPGHDLFNNMTPYVRTDENKPFKPPRKSPKKNGGFVDLEGQVPPAKTVLEEEVGMGGPEGRVYWPPGMEEWLRPKKTARGKAPRSLQQAQSSEQIDPENGDIITPPVSKTTQGAERSASPKNPSSRKRKAPPIASTPSASDTELLNPDELPNLTRSQTKGRRRSQRTKTVNYAEDSESM